MNNEEYTDDQLADIKARKRKINEFCANMGLQVCVFGTIIYATVLNNSVAGYMIEAYGWIVVMFLIGFAKTLSTSIPALARTAAESAYLLKTPTDKVVRGIGATFSVAEIIIFFQYGWPILGILWFVCEILQFGAQLKLHTALDYEFDDSDLDPEAIVMRKLQDAPEFLNDLADELTPYHEALLEIDLAIIEYETLNDSRAKSAIKDLKKEREEILQKMDALVDIAAKKAVEHDKK